ncbi:bone specific protein [Echinococcus granulosus]|uniref:Bone specific protein n=1 Tax=Echinococcus granulosus TaxID=6210 RepID=W6URV8_ECHGR|nr:bone specific protein [Echinococcus granulosus]EUB63953.1 bone specific protein [Echinococcus granulosus]
MEDKPVTLRHFAKSIYLTAGQPGHIVCCLSGFPGITQVMWHRSPPSGMVGLERAEKISTGLQSLSNHPFSTQELVRTSHPLNGVTCYKKLIASVGPEMSGAYTCQAKNALGWGSLSKPFNVFVKVQPHFTQKPDKFPSREVTFAEVLRSCKAAGFPPPEIKWVKYVLKAPKHMKRNISTSSEMAQTGEEWMLCPVESRTLCWTAERHEVAISKATQESGIFACTASNDLGSQIALTNLVTPKLSSEWRFSLETISPQLIRSGEFKVLGLSSNILTAVRVFVRCSRRQPVVSNTVYAWTRAPTDSLECSSTKTRQEPNSGTQSPFFEFAEFSFKQSRSWIDHCSDSPSVFKTTTSAPNTVDATSEVKGGLQLVAQVPEQLRLPELSFQRLDDTQTVTVIKNSIDDRRVLEDAPTERFNVSFYPHLGVFNLRQLRQSRRTCSPPKIGSKHKSCEASPQG